MESKKGTTRLMRTALESSTAAAAAVFALLVHLGVVTTAPRAMLQQHHHWLGCNSLVFRQEAETVSSIGVVITGGLCKE